MSGSGARAEYDRFLSQISGLQGDLGQAVALCKQLRGENDNLRQAFGRVRQDAVQFRRRWEQARSHALQEAEARVQAEQGHDEAIREFRALLEGKEGELAALKDKLLGDGEASRDEAVVRARVEEAVEARHRAALDEAKGALDRLRGEHFSLRREHELLRAEAEHAAEDRAKEAEATAEAHARGTQALRERVEVLQDEKEKLRAEALEARRSTSDELLRLKAQLRQAKADADRA